MREKPDTQATDYTQLALGRSAISKRFNSVAPRLSPNPVSNLARLNQPRIRLAPEQIKLQSELVDLSDNIDSSVLGSDNRSSKYLQGRLPLPYRNPASPIF
jgi:hypothetical protein